MSAEQLPRVLFERELVHRDNGERLRIMSAPGGWLLGCARMSDGAFFLVPIYAVPPMGSAWRWETPQSLAPSGAQKEGT